MKHLIIAIHTGDAETVLDALHRAVPDGESPGGSTFVWNPGLRTGRESLRAGYQLIFEIAAGRSPARNLLVNDEHFFNGIRCAMADGAFAAFAQVIVTTHRGPGHEAEVVTMSGGGRLTRWPQGCFGEQLVAVSHLGRLTRAGGPAHAPLFPDLVKEIAS